MQNSKTPLPSRYKICAVGSFLLLSIVVAGYVGFSLATGDTSGVRWPWLNEALGFAVGVTAPFAAVWLGWRLYSIANTVLDEDALIEPRLGATLRLPWKEVVSAEVVRENIHLKSPKSKAVVASGMYPVPEDVVACIASKVTCAVRRRAA